MLSVRQYEILAFLQKTDDYVTVQEIAEQLQVSSKTVRNEIGKVRQVLQEMNLGEIKSKSHTGIRLVITQECWEKLRVRTNLERTGPDSDSTLIYDIVCELLKKQTSSFAALEKQMCVTRPVIERVFSQVKSWFHAVGIVLVKEKGNGLTLKMPYLKRRYMISTALVHLCSQMEKEGGFGASVSSIESGEEKRLQFYGSFMDGLDLNGVLYAIKNTEKRFGFRFTYDGFQQVLIMVAISVLQVRKRMAMDFFTMRTRKTDNEFDEIAATYLISRLERNYNIVIPLTERDYIAYSLEIADIQNFTDIEAKLFCQSRSLELCRCTVKITSLMEDITGRELKKDDFFVENLFLQLRSMIGRRKYEINQKNPLVKQAKQKYNDIFVAIHGIAVFLEKELEIVLDEDEMCSLVLLLGGALLRGIAVVDACLVCNYYGIGSAHLLKKKLEREVNDLNIVAEFSARDLEQLKQCDCDLIISALPLDNTFAGKTVVLVEDLLLDYDIGAIESAMKEIRRKKVHSQALSKMFESKRVLFREEFVWFHMYGKDKYSVIQAMCERLFDAGYVTEAFKNSVISREKTLPTEIGQGIAIPHGDASYVIRSVVAVAFLNEEIPWGEEEKVDRVFLLAFNPDESSGMKTEILHFYKNFVVLLDDQDLSEKIGSITSEKVLADILNDIMVS